MLRWGSSSEEKIAIIAINPESWRRIKDAAIV
jgi:hypothetical protein